MATVELTYDGYWVPLDLDAEPAAAAAQIVRRQWEIDDCPADEELTRLISAAVARQLHRHAAEVPRSLLTLMLYPRADEVPVAIVSVRHDVLDAPIDHATIVEELSVPEPMLERPQEQAVVDTRSGPALRLGQCYRVPESPVEEQLYDQLVYAWVVGEQDRPVLVTLSTAFHDLTQARVWRDDVDKLARSLVIDLDPDGADGADGADLDQPLRG
jgi:hypothetical protein